jgi:subtilase family serine protease
VTQVRSWIARQLRARGFAVVEDGGDHFVVNATAAIVERELGYPVHAWEQKTTKRRIVKATGVAIPAYLAKHVEIITGLTELPMPKRQPKTRVLRKSGNKRQTPPDQQIIIPQYLRLLYNITDAPLSTSVSVCVAEFQDDAAYLQQDMSLFFQQVSEPPFIIKDVGPFTGSDTESTLDIQYAPAIARGAQAWFWVEKDWMHSFAAKLAKARPMPQVVSMSWGWPEKDQCLFESGPGRCHFTHLYVERTSTEFAKVTAQGTTLLASSGDQGAPGDSFPSCNGGVSDLFPSSSPYVTSVGATMIGPPASSSPVTARGGAVNAPVCQSYTCATTPMTESVCMYPNALITSGGSFSTYFAQPEWQKSAVAGYFAQNPAVPPSSMYKRTNRGFPDVAANGHNCEKLFFFVFFLIFFLRHCGAKRSDAASGRHLVLVARFCGSCRAAQLLSSQGRKGSAGIRQRAVVQGPRICL